MDLLLHLERGGRRSSCCQDDRPLPGLQRLLQHEARLGQGPRRRRAGGPLHPERIRSTSEPKSRCPGVSTMLMTVPVADRRVLGEDRDAALALEVAGVHDALFDVLALAERPRLLEEGVHQGRLSVVHVGHDGNGAAVRAAFDGDHGAKENTRRSASGPRRAAGSGRLGVRCRCVPARPARCAADPEETDHSLPLTSCSPSTTTRPQEPGRRHARGGSGRGQLPELDRRAHRGQSKPVLTPSAATSTGPPRRWSCYKEESAMTGPDGALIDRLVSTSTGPKPS